MPCIEIAPALVTIDEVNATGQVRLLEGNADLYANSFGWVYKTDHSLSKRVRIVKLIGEDTIEVRITTDDERQQTAPSFGLSDMTAFASGDKLSVERQMVRAEFKTEKLNRELIGKEWGSHVRAITIAGFVPDTAPTKAAPPPANQVFSLEGFAINGAPARGSSLVGSFDTDELTGALSFVGWYQDPATSEWFMFAGNEAVPATLLHRAQTTTADVVGLKIFIQALAFANKGAATKFTIVAREV